MRSASLVEIIEYIRAGIAAGENAVSITALDPDLGRGRYAGEVVHHAGQQWVHRPLRLWVDLAQRLQLRLCTPRLETGGVVRLVFERLDVGASWQPEGDVDPTEKYGTGSAFQKITKLEDPSFVLDFADAVDRASVQPDARILALGVNTGDDFALALAVRPQLCRATFVGIDHSASALQRARQRFPEPNFEFVQADLNALHDLDVGAFDLVLSFGTLQSPGVDDRRLLRHLVQDRLGATGSVVLGIPNCRYLDGELLHGATTKNFRQPELSLVFKHVAFFKKYLQQHRRKVYVTGTHYVLVTGVPSI